NHNAKTVTIEILDDSGQVKRTINLDNINEGEHVYEWNGEDDRGNELSEGNYQFRIKASNAEGEEISTRTYITGTITGVRYSDSGPVLILGEQQIKLSDVYEI
ncbi:flagellar biosynthesis protein FlgD, partial [Candidatus Saccharibacteria bacterium]|nr:flagellar biosynthesis protein FlgD [Candidatus Saccharibacteria bacterium]NIV73026.1 flagellar biosynthesis protein FlgD [Calditrichia bacterium]NIW80658.1 flagellar biosynthesis protein FlgD [Calditrichia bacterium]